MTSPAEVDRFDSTSADDASATALLLAELAEGQTLECKRASGRDGRGEVGRSFFESYSAMANTDGGVILLGVEERPAGVFRIVGLSEPERLRTDLWNALNDRDQVSANLLVDADVAIEMLQGLPVLRVRVPRARRTQRPVFVGRNPLGGSFRRSHSGDYRCDDDAVRRMMADTTTDTRDAVLLPGSSLEDLDRESFRAYRNLFRSRTPDHPFLVEDDGELLRLLGGWTVDRQTGAEGLTPAGLLMFGRLRSILDFFPNYVIDYQERPEPRGAISWVDRITTDGSWSGNLFDFYRRTIQRLVADLKVPFQLQGVTRVDDTPIHTALREALVNALIHADYGGTVPILVIKQPGLFSFRNPGTMRVPPEDALRGGLSDCRNRNLQKMFQLAGQGEQSGSGMTRIVNGWQEQHWRAPEIVEDVPRECTTLTLRTTSLLPDEVIAALTERFGAGFLALPHTQRLALATVEIEGQVTHARLRGMSDEHRSDLSRALSALVRNGYLESAGLARGTVYYFPAERGSREQARPPSDIAAGSGAQLDLFRPSGTGAASDQGGHQSAGGSSTDRPVSSTSEREYSTTEPHSSAYTDSLPTSSPEDFPNLQAIAQPVRSRRAASRSLVRDTILQVCAPRYLTSAEIGRLLNRNPSGLREGYLAGLVREGLLVLRYPDRPNHPEQAYRTSAELDGS